jgi:hypothetical protein
MSVRWTWGRATAEYAGSMLNMHSLQSHDLTKSTAIEPRLPSICRSFS